MQSPVVATHLSPIDVSLGGKTLGNELALLVGDRAAQLTIEEFLVVRCVIVLHFHAVEAPQVTLASVASSTL